MLRRPARALLAVLPAALLLTACGSAAASRHGFAGSEVDPPFTLPAGTFTTTTGASYDLAAQAKGHVTVLYFGYTNCPDICPTTMADLGTALRSMPAATAAQVQVVFVTSDPRRDTGPVMARWLANFDSGLAHPFVGLRTDVAAVDAYAGKVGIELDPPTVAADGSETVDHGAEVLVFSADGSAHLVEDPSTTAAQYAADLTKVVAGQT